MLFSFYRVWRFT